MHNDNAIEELQFKLDLELPANYKSFLLSEKSVVVDGFSVMGVPTKKVPQGVIEASQILKIKRPDLPFALIPIVFIKSKAVCLDISRSANGDAPLAEVSLQEKDAPLDIGYTFSEWLKYHQNLEARSQVAWQRIRNRQKETGGSTIQDWSTPVFKVQDYVVALGAFRFSFIEECLEIDEFFPIPQPNVAARLRDTIMAKINQGISLEDTKNDTTNKNPVMPTGFLIQNLSFNPHSLSSAGPRVSGIDRLYSEPIHYGRLVPPPGRLPTL